MIPPPPNYDHSVDRAEARAISLTRKYGVFQKNVAGAYPFAPLRSVEFLLHEVAHWMTLGHPLNKLSKRLSNQIEAVFNDGITTLSSNSLEVDTAMITYLAGWTLGFWKDPGPIVSSCRRNLKGIDSLRATDDDIYKRMVSRWTDHRDEYAKAAYNLAKWFRPSANLVPFPEASFP